MCEVMADEMQRQDEIEICSTHSKTLWLKPSSLPTISPEYTRLLGTDYLWDLCSKSLCLNRLPDLRPSIRAIQVYLFTNCPELSRNNLESFADMTHTTEGHNVYPQLISPTSGHLPCFAHVCSRSPASMDDPEHPTVSI